MTDNETKTAKVNFGAGSFYDAYDNAFGMVPTGTMYDGGMSGTSEIKSLQEIYARGMANLKVNTSIIGGTGSTDYVLAPVYLDQTIVDISRKFTPLISMLPRVTNRGRTADYNRITAKGSAVAYAEDAALADVADTNTRSSEPIKYLASVGRITGQARKVQPPFMVAGMTSVGSGTSAGSGFGNTGSLSPLAKEVQIRARAIKELEENVLINGDKDTYPTQFDGIVQLQSTTNGNTLGDSLGLDDMETSIEAAFTDSGLPDFAVASIGVVKDIRNLLRDAFRYSPADMAAGMMPFGMRPQLRYDSMIGPMPIVPSQYLSNTTTLKSIYFLQSDMMEVRVLQDMTYEPLAKTNDSDKFMLKQYECLIMRAPEFNSSITTLT